MPIYDPSRVHERFFTTDAPVVQIPSERYRRYMERKEREKQLTPKVAPQASDSQPAVQFSVGQLPWEGRLPKGPSGSGHWVGPREALSPTRPTTVIEGQEISPEGIESDLPGIAALVPPEDQGGAGGAAGAPAVADTADPFAPYQQMVDQLYPKPPSGQNPYQEQADQFASREMDRTNLLARLAFASGLTAAGGPGWDQIGRGLAAAGDQYDSGHRRYLEALQGAADRHQRQEESAYEREAGRSKTVADLYTAGEKSRIDAAKQARQAMKDENELIRKSLDLLKPGDFASPEEQELYREMLLRNMPWLRDVIDVADE